MPVACGIPLAVDQHLIEVPGRSEEKRKRTGTEQRQCGCGNNEAVPLSVAPQYTTNRLQVRPRVFTHEHGLSVPGPVVQRSDRPPIASENQPPIRAARWTRDDVHPVG